MFETIDDIAKARRACPRPGMIVKAVLLKDEASKSEVLTIALVSALAAMCLFNDKDGSNDVLSAFAGSKRTTIIKAVETAFSTAIRECSGIINSTGDASRVENPVMFVSMFSYAAGVLHENIKQAMAPKVKAPKTTKQEAPAPVATPQTPVIGVDPQSHAELLQEFNKVAAGVTENGEKIRALTADLAVKSAALKNADAKIELLQRQIEGHKLANYALKTRVTRLRSVANGYKVKVKTLAQKPTRATKSRVKV